MTLPSSQTPAMQPPIHIDVKTSSRAYQIHVGERIVDRLDQLLKDSGSSKQMFVISSPPIWKLHRSTFTNVLGKTKPLLMPDGEQAKTMQTIERLHEALIKGKADRGATIVSIGGGVVGDVAGFAAATYLRGVRLAHIPTTLLAQVDSSIGGKVGVNHALGKNLIGAFHQPIVVVTDPQFLETLPRREFRAGIYEIVKYGVIASRELFERVDHDLSAVFDRKPSVLVPVIAESCRIKAAIVSKDEREGDLRRTLNFGHTVGHAIEAASQYRRFRHGEAVAYGMLAAANIAMSRGLFPSADYSLLAGLIAKLGPLPSVNDLSVSQLNDAIRLDKKVFEGCLHMVLPTKMGNTMIVDDVTDQEIQAGFKAIGVNS
jgi:3-dehydroquinate synthase